MSAAATHTLPSSTAPTTTTITTPHSSAHIAHPEDAPLPTGRPDYAHLPSTLGEFSDPNEFKAPPAPKEELPTEEKEGGMKGKVEEKVHEKKAAHGHDSTATTPATHHDSSATHETPTSHPDAAHHDAAKGHASMADKLVGKTQQMIGKVTHKPEKVEVGVVRATEGKEAATHV